MTFTDRLKWVCMRCSQVVAAWADVCTKLIPTEQQQIAPRLLQLARNNQNAFEMSQVRNM